MHDRKPLNEWVGIILGMSKNRRGRRIWFTMHFQTRRALDPLEKNKDGCQKEKRCYTR